MSIRFIPDAKDPPNNQIQHDTYRYRYQNHMAHVTADFIVPIATIFLR
jgi:hypothetical protein